MTEEQKREIINIVNQLPVMSSRRIAIFIAIDDYKNKQWEITDAYQGMGPDELIGLIKEKQKLRKVWTPD